MRTEIQTKSAPAAVGPYSQAIVSGGFLFISGQLPIDPSTNQIAVDFHQQVNQCFKNLAAICQEARTDLCSAVKVTVIVADIEQFAIVNEIYEKYFKAPYPARIAYQSSGIPKNAKIMIDAIININ